MSSTTTPKRAGLDAFYTPDDVAGACVATIADDVRGRRVLEPHAGGGAFVRALLGHTLDVWAMDLDPQAPALAPSACPNRMWGDFLVDLSSGPGSAWGGDPPAWIVGNPPFNEAEAHVRRALSVATEGAAFLLRLAFLEGAKRREFWREHPAAEVHVLVSRPSFTGGGTDSAAYGWFVWRRGHVGPAHLRFLDWRSA